MRPITCPVAALAVVTPAAPVLAQDNLATLGYSVTVRTDLGGLHRLRPMRQHVD